MRFRRSILAPLFLGFCLAGCGAISGPAPSGPPAANIPHLADIPVGKAPIILAIAPDGGRVYAAGNDGNLVVIDTTTNAPVAKLSISPYSVAAAITPDGRKLLVSNLFGGALTVLDTTSNTLLPAMPLIADLRRGGYGRIAVSP